MEHVSVFNDLSQNNEILNEAGDPCTGEATESNMAIEDPEQTYHLPKMPEVPELPQVLKNIQEGEE